jgi:hypothetical protein
VTIAGLARFASFPRRLPVKILRYEYGFGFGNLYHPYTEVLRASNLAQGIDLLEQFYSAMSLWRAGLNNWQALPVQMWRFGKSRREEFLTDRVPSAHFGRVPGQSSRQAKTRAEHLFSLRDSISRHGFTPRGPQRMDGVWAGRTFLVLGGQHRIAVLEHLGWEKVLVVGRGRKNTPKRLVAPRLPLVKGGHLSLQDAENILARVEGGFSRVDARAAGFPFARDEEI